MISKSLLRSNPGVRKVALGTRVEPHMVGWLLSATSVAFRAVVDVEGPSRHMVDILTPPDGVSKFILEHGLTRWASDARGQGQTSTLKLDRCCTVVSFLCLSKCSSGK